MADEKGQEYYDYGLLDTPPLLDPPRTPSPTDYGLVFGEDSFHMAYNFHQPLGTLDPDMAAGAQPAQLTPIQPVQPSAEPGPELHQLQTPIQRQDTHPGAPGIQTAHGGDGIPSASDVPNAHANYSIPPSQSAHQSQGKDFRLLEEVMRDGRGDGESTNCSPADDALPAQHIQEDNGMLLELALACEIIEADNKENEDPNETVPEDPTKVSGKSGLYHPEMESISPAEGEIVEAEGEAGDGEPLPPHRAPTPPPLSAPPAEKVGETGAALSATPRTPSRFKRPRSPVRPPSMNPSPRQHSSPTDMVSGMEGEKVSLRISKRKPLLPLPAQSPPPTQEGEFEGERGNGRKRGRRGRRGGSPSSKCKREGQAPDDPRVTPGSGRRSDYQSHSPHRRRSPQRQLPRHRSPQRQPLSPLPTQGARQSTFPHPHRRGTGRFGEGPSHARSPPPPLVRTPLLGSNNSMSSLLVDQMEQMRRQTELHQQHLQQQMSMEAQMQREELRNMAVNQARFLQQQRAQLLMQPLLPPNLQGPLAGLAPPRMSLYGQLGLNVHPSPNALNSAVIDPADILAMIQAQGHHRLN